MKEHLCLCHDKPSLLGSYLSGHGACVYIFLLLLQLSTENPCQNLWMFLESLKLDQISLGGSYFYSGSNPNMRPNCKQLGGCSGRLHRVSLVPGPRPCSCPDCNSQKCVKTRIKEEQKWRITAGLLILLIPNTLFQFRANKKNTRAAWWMSLPTHCTQAFP